MKYLKICFVLLLVIFMTGCSVNYKVDIIDGSISETATFKLHNSNILNDSPYYTLQQMSGKYFISSDFLITQEKKEYFDNKYGFVDLKNTYNIKGYLNSYALSICYSAYNVVKEDNTIQISTSNKFLCYDDFSELSDVSVSVKTNHTVIEHNADEVVNDEYIWNITRENANNKPIKMIVSEEYTNPENVLKSSINIIITIFISILSLVIVGLVIILYVYFKNRKNK